MTLIKKHDKIQIINLTKNKVRIGIIIINRVTDGNEALNNMGFKNNYENYYQEFKRRRRNIRRKGRPETIGNYGLVGREELERDR